MSKYLSIDDSVPSEVSSNTGWGQFSAWVGTLADAPELSHLVEHGWAEPASAIRDELAAATHSAGMGDDEERIASTIAGLLSDAPDDGAVVISG